MNGPLFTFSPLRRHFLLRSISSSLYLFSHSTSPFHFPLFLSLQFTCIFLDHFLQFPSLSPAFFHLLPVQKSPRKSLQNIVESSRKDCHHKKSYDNFHIIILIGQWIIIATTTTKEYPKRNDSSASSTQRILRRPTKDVESSEQFTAKLCKLSLERPGGRVSGPGCPKDRTS